MQAGPTSTRLALQQASCSEVRNYFIAVLSNTNYFGQFHRRSSPLFHRLVQKKFKVLEPGAAVQCYTSQNMQQQKKRSMEHYLSYKLH
jgi:hypothetical protein